MSHIWSFLKYITNTVLFLTCFPYRIKMSQFFEAGLPETNLPSRHWQSTDIERQYSEELSNNNYNSDKPLPSTPPYILHVYYPEIHNQKRQRTTTTLSPKKHPWFEYDLSVFSSTFLHALASLSVLYYYVNSPYFHHMKKRSVNFESNNVNMINQTIFDDFISQVRV